MTDETLADEAVAEHEDVYHDHDEGPTEDTEVASQTKDVPRRHRLAPGDTVESVSEQYGVPVEEIAKRNDRQLLAAAQARGFPAHTHRRAREDGSGFDTGYHVFPGEELDLRDPVEGEAGYDG